jgi:zinc protease
VLAAVASGLGGRLFEALRDRRSLAYTVFAQGWHRAAAGAWLTYIATAPDREDEAREEMLRELARFATEEITPAELTQAVNYLAGQAEVRRQSGAAVLYEILEAWLTGEGLSELDDVTDRYRAVTAGDVRCVAESFLVVSRRAEGIVRGRSSD